MALPPPTLGTSVSTATKQGTVVKSTVSTVDPTRGSVYLVTITPDEFKAGDTVAINGNDYPVTSVVKPTIKTNSGSTMVQKSATIEIPEANAASPRKKYSFLIVKSF